MNDLTLAEIVNQVANRYARRCSWAALDDLKQEGWRAGLEARAWLSIPGYVHRCISVALYRFVWKESSPVTVNFNKLPVSSLASRYVGEVDGPSADDSPEEQVHHEYWKAALHSRVAAIARAELYPAHQEAAARCVLKLSNPAIEAVATGFAVPTIEKAATRLRKAMRRDPLIQELRQSI